MAQYPAGEVVWAVRSELCASPAMTNHLSPEEAFAAAAAEFDDGDARPGLLAMAEAQTDGDPARTRATYLRLRAAQLSGVPPAGARPAPPVGAPRRPAPPPPSEPKKTGVAIAIVAAVFLVLATLAFLFLNPERDAEGDALAEEVVEETLDEPRVEPVVVSVDCASTRSRVGGSGPGSLIGSALGSLTDKPSMEATVTVRNAGAPGEVVVAVAAFSEEQGGAMGREQTVRLASGERRQLSFTFDPTPFSRGGACRAWVAPVGDALADFDAFVETYNAIPEPRPEPQRAPEPEPEPFEPEVVEPEPAPAPPPREAQPPRTPQPPADPPTDGGASGSDGVPGNGQ